MFRYKRLIIFSVLINLLVLLLTACGSTTPTSTSSGPVNLTYWSWIPGMDKQVALFNKTHSNIHVTLSNVGSGPAEYNKLYTAIKAKNAPDLAQIEYQLLPTFETTGGLLDLAPYGVAADKDKYQAWTWSQMQQGSSIYGIPQDTGPMVMFYRADLFQKYNIPVPTTWAEYADAATKLHAADANDFIADFPPKNPGQFAGLAWQAGARWFTINGTSWKVTINDAATVKVANYWQNLISSKLVKTEPDFTDAWYHDLQTGSVATWMSGAWGSGIISANAAASSGDWRVAPLPQWQAGQNVAGNWGGSLTVAFKNTQHAQEAATFARWIAGDTTSEDLEIKGAGAYPALNASLNSTQLNSPQPFYGNQDLNDVIKVVAAHIDVNFSWGPTMDQVYADMGNDFADAVNGKQTLSDAVNATQQSTTTFMQKQGFSLQK